MPNWLKQPWAWILIGVIALLLLITVVYFYGKSAGRAAASTAFDQKQAALLKQSQDALSLADASQKKAIESEAYAAELKKAITLDRATAAQKEQAASDVYKKSTQEINTKYEQDKNSINADVSACDRCSDLCRRTNALAQYGPEFASYHCDPATDCAASCTTGSPQGP